jgi:acyl dehydratase
MAAITERHRSLLGRESEPLAAPYAINEAMARHWSEMVEDANPIYFDEAYARTTWLQGTFAPPAMLFTWGRHPVWPPSDRKPAIDTLNLDGCPTTIAVNAVQEYFLPLRYGDTLTVTQRLESLSNEKTTRLGTGHFVTTVDTFRNQHGQVVGTHTFTLFTYRPASQSSP